MRPGFNSPHPDIGFMHFISPLLSQTKVNHYISTIDNGNMSFGFGKKESVIENREKFLSEIKIPSERVVVLKAQHGTKIIEATESLAGTGIFSSETAIKADALVTREKNLALFLLTADCIPAIFYNREKEVIGLSHISRRNTMQGFSQILVSLFKRDYEINPHTLTVYFGPSIKKESYVLPEYPHGFDLIEENINQLAFKGVLKENIHIDLSDTASSSNFFSHYRAARTPEDEGRVATVLMQV